MLEARGVEKSYKIGKKRIKVLKNVNMKVKEGEFVAISGPSGAGKTTLMYILSGILLPDKGEVIHFGKKINDMGEDARAKWRREKLGVVFQFLHLIPTLTVLENVMLVMELAGKRDEARARRVLELLGVGHYVDRYPIELSGGEQQRVAIARALANDPLIILADEPTSNLDKANRERVINILREEARKGKIVIVVSHEDEVLSAADRVCFLQRGEMNC